MSKPLIIGITGGIGSGKSTFAEVLRRNGFFVYDSDIEARRLQNENTVIRYELIETFGQEIYDANGLDRKKLASIVFENPDLLKKINSIVHPAVLADFMIWKEFHSSEKFLFLETAILYESKFNVITDKVILITASENIRIKRVMKRDGISEKSVKSKIKNQLSDNEKIRLADIVINTDDGLPSQNAINNILIELAN